MNIVARTGKTFDQLRSMKDGSLFLTSRPLREIYKMCAAIGGSIHECEGVWRKPDGAAVKICSTGMLLRGNVNALRGQYFTQIEPEHCMLWDDEIARGYATVVGSSYCCMRDQL